MGASTDCSCDHPHKKSGSYITIFIVICCPVFPLILRPPRSRQAREHWSQAQRSFILFGSGIPVKWTRFFPDTIFHPIWMWHPRKVDTFFSGHGISRLCPDADNSFLNICKTQNYSVFIITTRFLPHKPCVGAVTWGYSIYHSTPFYPNIML